MQAPAVRFTLTIAAWIAACAAGLVSLTFYKSEPGAAGEAPDRWPSDSRLALAGDRPTLVLAAHPQCGCTRATLAELARLVSQVNGAVAIHVLFHRPPGVGDDWTRTDLWETARHIAGAALHEDVDGAETRRFGAETSGQVVIYDTAGRKLFAGGITGSRGHEGSNVGLKRAVESVRAGSRMGDAPVFGCAFASKNDRQRDGE